MLAQTSTTSTTPAPAKAPKAPKVQNPSRYLQLKYKQIKYAGKRGDVIKKGMSGNRVVAARKKLGLYVSQYCPVDNAMVSKVKAFQRKKKLKVTGKIDLNTWQKLGLSKKSFTSMDNTTHELVVKPTMSKKQIIEAMVKTAYEFKGRPYVGGGSGSSRYGVDCSGLTMQALYAIGIDPKPSNSYRHSHSTKYRYESRNLSNNSKLKHVSLANIKRGDLIFYSGSSGVVSHVAIYLGKSRIIHSMPGRGVVVEGISRGGAIKSAARPVL
jgi:cell wall-associated NlpC family hydrolase